MVGGAAVTEEFHPGFRNSVAAYTVSLLNPKVIADLDLHATACESSNGARRISFPRRTAVICSPAKAAPRHRNREVQRPGRRALSTPSRRELERHRRRPARSGAASAAQSRRGGWLARLSRAAERRGSVGSLRGLDFERQRALLDLFTKSAADYLDGWFESDLVKAVYGFDAHRRQLCEPLYAGHGLRAAAPRLRRGERQEAASGAMRSAAWARSRRRWQVRRARTASRSKPSAACAR